MTLLYRTIIAMVTDAIYEDSMKWCEWYYRWLSYKAYNIVASINKLYVKILNYRSFIKFKLSQNDFKPYIYFVFVMQSEKYFSLAVIHIQMQCSATKHRKENKITIFTFLRTHKYDAQRKCQDSMKCI